MPTDARAWVFPLSLIRRTTPFCRIILTTNKGMWMIYSNLDPQGSIFLKTLGARVMDNVYIRETIEEIRTSIVTLDVLI